MDAATPTTWSFRSWGTNLLLAVRQGLLFAIGGGGVASLLVEQVPAWAVAVPSALGALWALPTGVRLGADALVVRNEVRRHVIPLHEIVVLVGGDRVSGRGLLVRVRTTSRRRGIRVAALAGADASTVDTLDLLVREQRRPHVA